jgi:integrase
VPVEAKAFDHAMARLWAPRREGGRTKREGLKRGVPQAEVPALLSTPPATPHDLRRSMRTHLEMSLGVEPHVAERALGHSLGKIFSTYARRNYFPARREAAIRWAEFVERLVTCEPAAVVPIRTDTVIAMAGAK